MTLDETAEQQAVDDFILANAGAGGMSLVQCPLYENAKCGTSDHLCKHPTRAYECGLYRQATRVMEDATA
jgi:hypothetical protein